jgi:selenocysteine-specific elongation factor
MVVDPAPRRRHRRFRPEIIDRLKTLAHGTPEEIVLQALEREQPLEARELVKRLTLPAQNISETLNAMLSAGHVLVVDDAEGTVKTLPSPAASARFLVSSLGWRQMTERMRDILVRYHEAFPLRRGMPREELRSQLQQRATGLSGRLFNQIVARGVHEGLVGASEDSVWTADHSVTFTPEQRQQVDDLLARFARAPYTTPSVAECVAQLGPELFNALLEDGTLVRLSPEVVYQRATLDSMRQDIIDHIRREGGVTVAQARDLFGASRKYTVALMEYLDQQRVTKRVGDTRVLR